MTSASDQLFLTDADLIGEGAHKITYAHPTKKNLCVKLTRTPHDIDLSESLLTARQEKNTISYLNLCLCISEPS